MIEPNRLSAPGERAALERLEEILLAVDSLRLELFVPSPLDLLDPVEHARLQGILEAEADRCGRRALLDEVRDRVRSALGARIARPVRFEPFGQAPVAAAARAEDAALVVLIVLDAVAVAVVEDRLPGDLAGTLAGPGRRLLGLPPLGGMAEPQPDEEAGPGFIADEAASGATAGEAGPGAIAGEGAPGAIAGEAAPGPSDVEPGPSETLAPAPSQAPVPEPSAEDWANAAAGPGPVPDHQPRRVGLRVAVATIAACVLSPTAVFVGVAAGQTVPGILAGLAIVALCWLLATYRR